MNTAGEAAGQPESLHSDSDAHGTAVGDSEDSGATVPTEHRTQVLSGFAVRELSTRSIVNELGKSEQRLADAHFSARMRSWKRLGFPTEAELPAVTEPDQVVDPGQINAAIDRSFMQMGPDARIAHGGGTPLVQPQHLSDRDQQRGRGRLHIASVLHSDVRAQCLLRAERHLFDVADLVDDITAALHADSTAIAVRGTLEQVSGAVVDEGQVMVAAVGTQLAVDTGAKIIELSPGELLTTNEVSSIEPGDPAGAYLVISLQQFTAREAWALASTRARLFPRLRADLPFDPDQPSEMYGFDLDQDAIAVLTAEIDELLTEDLLSSLTAWWCANLQPSPRTYLGPARLVEDFRLPDEARIRGRLVGGLALVATHRVEQDTEKFAEPSQLGSQTDAEPVQEFVAGGMIFPHPSACGALLEAVLGGEWIAPAEFADSDDPDLGRWIVGLGRLGLVEFA